MNTSSSRLLAASCGNIVKVWDPFGSASQSRETFFNDAQPVESVVWSPDGTSLAFAGDSRVISLKRWTEKKESTLQSEVARRSPIRTLRFGADGLSLVSGSQDGSVTLWNCTNERQMGVVKESACEVTSMATSRTPDPNAWSLAFANSSGDLSIYQVENHVASRIGKISDTTLCSKTCSAFSPFIPGGQLFLGSGNKRGQITIWDAATRYSYFAKTIHKEAITEICFPGRCDQVLTSGMDGTVCNIDLRTSRVNAVSLGGPVCSMSLHPDCRILVFGNEGGEICIKDQRKMNESILSCFVHPDASRLTVSSLMWQPAPQQQQNCSKKDSISKLRPSEIQEQDPRPKTAEFPFSPVRTGRSSRPRGKVPEGSRSVNLEDRTLQRGSSNGASMTPAPSFNQSIVTEDSGTANEQRLSPICEQSNGKGAPFIFKTPSKHKAVEIDSSARVRLDVRSVDRHERITKLPHTMTVPSKANLKDKTVATPIRRKARSLQKKAMKGADSVLSSDRKRPRKSGSFSDFASCRSTTPEPEASTEDHGDADVESKAEKEYWKNQYMQLREDFLSMHFELMKEVRMQSVEFTRRYDEMQRQQDNTNEKLAQLTKLVEQHLNDSIRFI